MQSALFEFVCCIVSLEGVLLGLADLIDCFGELFSVAHQVDHATLFLCIESLKGEGKHLLLAVLPSVGLDELAGCVVVSEGLVSVLVLEFHQIIMLLGHNHHINHSSFTPAPASRNT